MHAILPGFKSNQCPDAYSLHSGTRLRGLWGILGKCSAKLFICVVQGRLEHLLKDHFLHMRSALESAEEFEEP
jgi:hypothetical protein